MTGNMTTYPVLSCPVPYTHTQRPNMANSNLWWFFSSRLFPIVIVSRCDAENSDINRSEKQKQKKKCMRMDEQRTTALLPICACSMDKWKKYLGFRSYTLMKINSWKPSHIFYFSRSLSHERRRHFFLEPISEDGRKTCSLFTIVDMLRFSWPSSSFISGTRSKKNQCVAM